MGSRYLFSGRLMSATSFQDSGREGGGKRTSRIKSESGTELQWGGHMSLGEDAPRQHFERATGHSSLTWRGVWVSLLGTDCHW